MKKLTDSKIIVSLLIVLVTTVLVLSGITLVDYMNRRNENELNKALAATETLYFGDSPNKHDGRVEVPKIVPGKYYLNGDTDEYYFEIHDDYKIELCCDDKYSLFEKWNPGKEDVINSFVSFWENPRDFRVIVTDLGTVILAVDWTEDESGTTTHMTSGPVLADEYTLTGWGIEGDFIRVD